MRKIVSMILVLSLIFTMAACGNTPPAEAESSGSGTPSGEAASNVPAGEVTLNMLSHTYASLEYYGDQLKTKAPEGVTLEAEMTNYSDCSSIKLPVPAAQT